MATSQPLTGEPSQSIYAEATSLLGLASGLSGDIVPSVPDLTHLSNHHHHSGESDKSTGKQPEDDVEMEESSGSISSSSSSTNNQSKKRRNEKKRECIGEGCSSTVSGRKLCTACQRKKKNGVLKVKEGTREGRILKPYNEQRNKSYTLHKATEALKKIHEQLPPDVFLTVLDSVAPELKITDHKVHKQIFDNALATYQQLPRLSPNRPALLKALSHDLKSATVCELFAVSRQTLSHARNYKDEENPLKYLKYKQNCKRPRKGGSEEAEAAVYPPGLPDLIPGVPQAVPGVVGAGVGGVGVGAGTGGGAGGAGGGSEVSLPTFSEVALTNE